MRLGLGFGLGFLGVGLRARLVGFRALLSLAVRLGARTTVTSCTLKECDISALRDWRGHRRGRGCRRGVLIISSAIWAFSASLDHLSCANCGDKVLLAHE